MIELNTLNGNMNNDAIFSPRYFPPDLPISSSPFGTASPIRMEVPISCVDDINEAFNTFVSTKAHNPICNLIGYKNGEPVYKDDKPPVKYIEW